MHDDLKAVAKVLGVRVIFKPDAFIVDGYLYNCVCEESSVADCVVALPTDLPCYDLCLDEGRYCANDPADHDLDVGLSGKDLVIESLTRRMVIWDTHEMEECWDYVEQFAMNCLGGDHATDFQVPCVLHECYGEIGNFQLSGIARSE